jgi:Holliday junction resolvasome RuvABC ATP-dependent DNA helicase subunit
MNTFFIGQDDIILQLGDILPYVYHSKQGVNLLFRGASGFGKTYLAEKCCRFLVKNKYESCLGKNFTFNPNVWVHFIDEIHTMENPETLYPLMDSGMYVIVFATNFDSILPEALTNRCRNFLFGNYTDEELKQIFKFHSKLRYPEEVLDHIINVSGRNPRIIVKTFGEALKMHYKLQVNVPNNGEEIIKVIDTLFGIQGELDRPSRQYLETLESLGGRASINLIASAMHIDLNSIKYQIEPALLYKKLIKITSRGRELTND